MEQREEIYWRRRLEQELAQAEQADDPNARAAHLSLAKEYEIKLHVGDVMSKAGNDRGEGEDQSSG